MIDMACIVDYDKKNEFVLGTVIYVNENEILNEGVYYYERIGNRFFKRFGSTFYDYEVKRLKAHGPDNSKYSWKL